MHEIADGPSVGQDDVGEEFLFEDADAALDRLELGLDDKGQSAPALADRLFPGIAPSLQRAQLSSCRRMGEFACPRIRQRQQKANVPAVRPEGDRGAAPRNT
ncbi:MAG: hypothetical protein ACREE4_23270 [Stellaceae bacterium]